METADNHPSSLILSKSCGCLFGGAVGDALGSPVEFMSRKDILRTFGPEGVTGYELSYGRRARISHNTQMTLFTAEGLLRAQVRYELKGIGPIYSSIVAHAYQRWLKTQNIKPAGEVAEDGWLFQVPELHQSRAPGKTCISALKSLKRRGERARNHDQGCEGVMRAAPVGLFGCRTLNDENGAEKIFDLGCEIAWVTHGHPNGFLPAGCLALIVACLMNDGQLAEAIECAVGVLRQKTGHEETLRLILRAKGIYEDRTFSPESATVHLGRGRYGHEALALAILFALSASDFDDGIRLSVNHNGDSSTTGSLTGNILGVRWGADSINWDEWLDSLEIREAIKNVAVDLVSWPWWDFENDEVWERYPGH